jgi:hypothetical protein
MLLRVKQLKMSTYGLYAFMIIAVASLLRLFLIIQGWPHSNSDEATMGIIAMHIANKGEHPLFFYGQNYMGTLEAYLAAGFFRLFGASIVSLRLGPLLLFALFLSSMYFLTSLLYTKKLALITLALLALGSVIMLDTELVAIGGYPELLFFGTLSLLLASWLALSYDQYTSPRRRLWRLVAYTCWGLVVGLGFWSDFLMLPFILVSSLLLAVFCWRELLKGAVLPLLLGLVIGAFPLIAYNLHATPGENTLNVLSYLRKSGSIELAQLSAKDHLPLGPQLRGTMLTSLPAATGGMPFCYDSLLRFTGNLRVPTLRCSLLHADRSIVVIALAWSLGYLMLWTIAVSLLVKNLWQFLIRSKGLAWTPTERQSVIRPFARLMLLCSSGLILLLFITSPVSGAFPGNSRYLAGLLISTPALIAPLWGLSNDGSFIDGMSATDHPHKLMWFPFAFNVATLKVAIRRGIVLFIGIVLLAGTISAFLEIPTVQANNRQQDVLIQDLLRIRATHIYTDYWTCDSIAFLSKEQIKCAVVTSLLQLDPRNNRYLPYKIVVTHDPNAVYVFPFGSNMIPAINERAARSPGRYIRFVFGSYVVYQPVGASSNITTKPR